MINWRVRFIQLSINKLLFPSPACLSPLGPVSDPAWEDSSSPRTGLGVASRETDPSCYSSVHQVKINTARNSSHTRWVSVRCSWWWSHSVCLMLIMTFQRYISQFIIHDKLNYIIHLFTLTIFFIQRWLLMSSRSITFHCLSFKSKGKFEFIP